MNAITSFEKVLICLSIVFLFVITYNKVINVSSIKTFETSDTTPLFFDKLSENLKPYNTLTSEKNTDKKPVVQTSKSLLNPININTATSDELCQISGIGEVLANRIVAFRNQNGNFKSLEELMLVKGIGESIFLKIKPYLCLK